MDDAPSGALASGIAVPVPVADGLFHWEGSGVPASLAADAPVSAADGVTRSSPPWLEFVLEPPLHAVVLPITRTSANSRSISTQ
jgi:hypothetical protein